MWWSFTLVEFDFGFLAYCGGGRERAETFKGWGQRSSSLSFWFSRLHNTPRFLKILICRLLFCICTKWCLPNIPCNKKKKVLPGWFFKQKIVYGPSTNFMGLVWLGRWFLASFRGGGGQNVGSFRRRQCLTFPGFQPIRQRHCSPSSTDAPV